MGGTQTGTRDHPRQRVYPESMRPLQTTEEDVRCVPLYTHPQLDPQVPWFSGFGTFSVSKV